MASVVTETNGRRLIQLSPSEHPNRPKIRLGKITKRDAETVRVHIEKLHRARKTGGEIPPATAEWVVKLSDNLRDRLEKYDLIVPRERKECPTLAEWLDSYMQGRSDLKEGTRKNYKKTIKNMKDFFGESVKLDEITPGDADEYRIYLKSIISATATVNERCKRAKQFFRAAVRKGIIAQSPFADMKCGSQCNPDRYYFVSQGEIQAVLDACPDIQWKLIFALARFGGLRTPSEMLPLTWEDIHFDKRRITVRSPKTAYQGKSSRVIPLFPELEPLLIEAFELAEPGDQYIISRYRYPVQNLRAHAHRIIRLAGLEPWPKTFQNLRSSRETELAETYPVQVVCSWIGNSLQVAAKHYLQVTDDHYKKAVQNPVQTVQEKPCQEASEMKAKNEKTAQVIACQKLSKSFTENDLNKKTPKGSSKALFWTFEELSLRV